MRKWLTITVLAASLLAGCSGAGGSRAAAPATDGSQAPKAADDVSINAVLAGLDRVMGDLERILVRERRITPEVTERLRAIYVGPELLNQIDAFKVDVSRGLTAYRSPPGNRLTVVSRLLTAGPDCVFAQVKRDYSPTTVGPAQPLATLYVVLVAKDAADDPRGYNPTAWAMLYDGVQQDGTQPEDICK